MAQWLRLNLNRGTLDGARLISEESIDEMQSAHTIIPLKGLTQQLNPESHFVNYGLAWDLSDYKGRKLVRHGGGIDGMHTQLALIPEEDLGVIVLSNTTSSFLPYAVAYRALDTYLGLPERDWSVEFRKIYDDLLDLGKEAEEKRRQKRAKNISPSLDGSAYAGSYESLAYGIIEVTLEGEKLGITRGPSFSGSLTHWHFDTFSAKWTDPTREDSLFTFSLNADGEIVSVNSEALGEFKRIEKADVKDL
jgi:CubicO group peptidase (beta-lactamase class C family)